MELGNLEPSSVDGGEGSNMYKVELSIRDQLEILAYRGSDKDILDIQKEVRQDWLKYLTRKK